MTAEPNSPDSNDTDNADTPPGEFVHLRDAYRDLRVRTVAMCRPLTDEQGSVLTPTCPAWSMKDVVAHMAGVCADILDRNTEGAATEAWADSHVDQRQDLTLAEVLDEWEERAPQLDEVIEYFAAGFPPQFYLDAWTHEWDLRQALSAPAEPDMRFIDAHLDWMEEKIQERFDQAGLEVVNVRASSERPTLGLDDFELMRLGMGRRSVTQAETQTITRPDGSTEPAPEHGVAVILWSPNPLEIVDPVLGAGA